MWFDLFPLKVIRGREVHSVYLDAFLGHLEDRSACLDRHFLVHVEAGAEFRISCLKGCSVHHVACDEGVSDTVCCMAGSMSICLHSLDSAWKFILNSERLDALTVCTAYVAQAFRLTALHGHPCVVFDFVDVYQSIAEDSFAFFQEASDMVSMEVCDEDVVHLISSCLERFQDRHEL